MKITSFNPLIITQNAADTVKLFEELGFEVLWQGWHCRYTAPVRIV